MDIKELRNMSTDRLKEMSSELAEKIRSFRFTVQTRQQGHVRTLRNAKRDLAQLLTILSEKDRTNTPDQH